MSQSFGQCLNRYGNNRYRNGNIRYRNKMVLKNAFVAAFNIFACFVAKSSVPAPFSLMHGKISSKWRRKGAKHCSNEPASVYRENLTIRRRTVTFTNYGTDMNSGISVTFAAILHGGVLCAPVKPGSGTRNLQLLVTCSLKESLHQRQIRWSSWWCSKQLKSSACILRTMTKTGNKELFYLEAQMLYSKLNHGKASKKHNPWERTISVEAITLSQAYSLSPDITKLPSTIFTLFCLSAVKR